MRNLLMPALVQPWNQLSKRLCAKIRSIDLQDFLLCIYFLERNDCHLLYQCVLRLLRQQIVDKCSAPLLISTERWYRSALQRTNQGRVEVCQLYIFCQRTCAARQQHLPYKARAHIDFALCQQIESRLTVRRIEHCSVFLI